jgi:thiol:disulfide interchange protein
VLAVPIPHLHVVVQHRSLQTRPALSFVVHFIALAALLAGSSAASAASPPANELVQAELIAEPPAVAPGRPFWVGMRLRIKEHWHVYWRNPGDSGEAVTINWRLPPGFAAGPIAWPKPQRIPVAHLANFGYEREVTLLARITPPAALALAAPIDLAADVTWLVCEQECIPGEASLLLSLPVAGPSVAAAPDAATSASFDAARRALPQPAPWAARMQIAPDRLTLDIDARGLNTGAVRAAYFFPNSETLVRHAAPQQLDVTRDGLILHLERSALSTAPPTDAGGVLVIEEALGPATTRQAFELANVAIGQGAAPYQAASLAAVLQAAFLALVGGVILNLMPCVFPVLSIKVLALVEQAGGPRRDVRRHGLAYTGGVLVAFTALAIALLGVRAAGTEVGWGFQLQSPVTVALLAYLLLAMGLSLSGVFHLGSSVQGLGRGLAQRAGLAGSFFTGVLAAVVATPCTAPFMGTALGFALTQPAALAFAVILALGVGLALPFLVLTLAPQLIGRLPRPGAWMETLRQLLAFPVYATVAWLVWVLGQQVGPAGLLAALVGLVLVGLAGWSFNVAQSAGGWGRRMATGALAASLVGIAVAVVGLERDRGESPGTPQSASTASYERFTQARLDALIATERPVFVNMTAGWCITCLVNERATLATEAVQTAFAAKGVAYLKGDWTSRNPEITRLLERHGRSGVPLYLLYAGGGEPVVLPQILTAATVLGEIDRIPDPPQRRASLSTPTISSIATKE